ncbi:hypothetical protein [Acetobacter pasteurianus]|nr:hypothetical protein [Acetobacter pasteurianus]
MAIWNGGSATASPSRDRAEHTVSWYAAHRSEDVQVLHECQNDRTFENYPDCKNAAAGDELYTGKQRQATGPDSSVLFTNGPLRAAELAKCKLSNPRIRPPKADCDAAARIQTEVQNGKS